jgi:hypothetical protein
VAWIREHFGECDEEGRICLLMEGQDLELRGKAPELHGKALAEAALEQITDHPETWNQESVGSCHGSHCFLGWVIDLAGVWQEWAAGRLGHSYQAAGRLLGVTEEQAYEVWNPHNTLERLREFTAAVGNPKLMEKWMARATDGQDAPI